MTPLDTFLSFFDFLLCFFDSHSKLLNGSFWFCVYLVLGIGTFFSAGWIILQVCGDPIG